MEPSLEDDTDVAAVKLRCADLQKRATFLLEELDRFENHLGDKISLVKVRDLKRSIQKEINGLVEKVMNDTVSTQKSRQVMTSSNLPYYEALWAVAKTCDGLTGFRRQFFTHSKKKNPDSSAGDTNGHNGTSDISGKTIVDIIAQNDLEWIKVCTMSEKSMIHELAKQGWVDDSEDEDEPDFDDSNSLFKQMSGMLQASRLQKVRYQHPKVRLVLTKLRANTAASKLLDRIRAMGIIVQTAEEFPPPIPLSQETLNHMTAEESLNFSHTLNIDCSILLGCVSDISHQGVVGEEWHTEFITEQIEHERKVKLMPRTIWPICGERKLMCTREAATKMLQIVGTIATETERVRTALLLGTDGLSQEESVAEFQNLSDYQVPLDWQIPLKIVDVDLASLREKVSPVIHELFDAMLEVNQSVFFYGWTEGLTTVTANAVGDRAIQNVIEKHNLPEPAYGFPNIWTCGIARSLVGIQKDSSKGRTNVGQLRGIRKAIGGKA